MLRRGCVYSCYYTSRVCKYFIDGECYEHNKPLNNESACATDLGGVFVAGLCYYHMPQNCTAGHYLRECSCYPHQSATYSNSTCYNIGGYYTDDYCYYMQFNCSGYSVNDQCYSRVNMKL